MHTIKVVYERDKVLLDKNNNIITYQMLPECVKNLFFQGMNGHEMDYYQEIYDSYYGPEAAQIMEMNKNTCFYEDPDVVYQENCLVTASQLKSYLPDTKILFKNKNKYYDFPIDDEGFSEIPKGFDISTVILYKGKKELKVMFDYEATGIWDAEGKCTPVEWVPASQVTRDLINQFQKGLNSMRIDYDNDYTKEEDEEADRYMLLGLKGAIELKKELPDWKINFYKYGCYFDLPLNPYDNCSEITADLIAEKVGVNPVKR